MALTIPQGNMMVKLAAEQAASGTSISFTGIPAGTSVIYVTFEGISVNGTVIPLVQIGDSGGLETSSYLGAGSLGIDATTPIGATATTGYATEGAGSGATVLHGIMTLVLSDATNNTWIAAGTLGRSDAAGVHMFGGSKSLSAVLTQVAIVTGSNSFDAGSFSVSYL